MLAPLKLLDLMTNKSEAMAAMWARDVIRNHKTLFYHRYKEDEVILQAADFYKELSGGYPLKNPYPKSYTFMPSYAQKRFEEGVPLHEVLYAIILMRCHIWLYAEFQAIFITITEQHQALDKQTRTILIFDYIAYALAVNYGVLMGEHPTKNKTR